MPLKIDIKGLEKLPAAFAREKRRQHRAALVGIKAGVNEVKLVTRNHVRRAFRKRGFRVATIVRGEVFDNGLNRKVVGRVRSAWRKRVGAATVVDPIAARLFGATIRAKPGGWLTIPGKRAPANVGIARRQQKTHWQRVRPGVLVLIGKGKSGRAKPRILFTLVKKVVIRGMTTPRQLLTPGVRKAPEAIRDALKRTRRDRKSVA